MTDTAALRVRRSVYDIGEQLGVDHKTITAWLGCPPHVDDAVVYGIFIAAERTVGAKQLVLRFSGGTDNGPTHHVDAQIHESNIDDAMSVVERAVIAMRLAITGALPRGTRERQ